ncbi:hypothetical protein BJ875DRAFT_4778 [Amylocarpus encephaloides]|uniref:Pre-mRNA splicing factor CLF1 n=1 Tax=Amylocarpus encephaloides TaxID=45428 RepID=A0A9P7YSY1_9HELO|nr:hypothetical protein BJ875DRAFT_4778 [Amylocarpus encephaloides]
MPLPQPSSPLDNSCSAIFNNTLYTYTSTAFQSLKLEQGAEWEVLPAGVSIKGGVCVKSTPADNDSAAALWIVGGTANSSDYQGLQKFTFANSSWATIQPNVPVTQNRLWHNAVYLNASDSILVYAGTQDGTKQPTSQTFTINATEPHVVLAYEAAADPAISPILIPYTQSMALYIGGSETNAKAMLFSATTGWKDSNSTLANPFYNSSNIKAIVINGDDASKSLYTFDMTVSPNRVNRTIIVDADGNAVKGAVPVATGRHAATHGQKVRRGDLTVQNWPTYNDSLVPSSARTGDYALSRDQNGLVVVSGGNEQDVLCMFRARENTWVNATELLLDSSVTQQTVGITAVSSTSAASTPSETAPAASSSTVAAAPASSTGTKDPPFPVKILGAVLGSIIGLALIFLAILFLLRWKRKRRSFNDAAHRRRSSGIPGEKNTMDFMDRGLPQMSSARQVRGHQAQPSGGSFSSIAILMGRVGHERGDSKENGGAGSDTSSQLNKSYKTAAISKPIPQEPVLTSVREAPREEAAHDPSRPPLVKARGMSRVRGSTRRSSGWNRYWSGGSSMNILGFGGSRRTTMEDGGDRDSAFSETHRSQFTQSSAAPPPLKVPIPGQPELSKVNTGSPTIANHSSTYPLTREMSGTIERAGSMSSMSSYTDDRDAYSSGVPASVHEQNQWTPVDGQQWGRNPSVAYTESIYAPTIARNTNQFPRELQFPTPPSAPPQRPPPHQSDMSWLNLGNGNNNDR